MAMPRTKLAWPSIIMPPSDRLRTRTVTGCRSAVAEIVALRNRLARVPFRFVESLIGSEVTVFAALLFVLIAA